MMVEKMMVVINKQQVGTFGACVVNTCLNIQKVYVHRLDTPYSYHPLALFPAAGET